MASDTPEPNSAALAEIARAEPCLLVGTPCYGRLVTDLYMASIAAGRRWEVRSGQTCKAVLPMWLLLTSPATLRRNFLWTTLNEPLSRVVRRS